GEAVRSPLYHSRTGRGRRRLQAISESKLTGESHRQTRAEPSRSKSKSALSIRAAGIFHVGQRLRASQARVQSHDYSARHLGERIPENLTDSEARDWRHEIGGTSYTSPSMIPTA